MTSIFVPLLSTPETGSDEIASLYLNQQRVNPADVLTLDWAGGGLAETSDDCLRLIRGLHSGELLSAESWAWLTKIRHTPKRPLLRGWGDGGAVWGPGVVASGLATAGGYLGITAAHLGHHPVHDAVIVITFGSTKAMRPSVVTLVKVVALLRQFR